MFGISGLVRFGDIGCSTKFLLGRVELVIPHSKLGVAVSKISP